jgi:hypothetical protein
MALMLLNGCGVFGKAKKEREFLRAEAKNFSLTVVKAYFREDCGFVYNAFSDSVLIMEGAGMFTDLKKNEKICRSIRSAIRDKSKNYQNYLETYQVELLTQKELQKTIPVKLPSYIKMTNKDFFFMGYKMKEDQVNMENFIWDDLFIFMVRKEESGWKIKGISG